MRTGAFVFVFLLLNLFVTAQTPDDHWIFGYKAWVKFNAGIPGAVGTGPIWVDEGSSCISDKNGNLLFSTSGEDVFDKNGVPMPNGFKAKGHISSTQNALIVPFPGDLSERYYYIFTVAAEANWPSTTNTGLEYVVVDMQANGGLGDVIGTSTELIPYTGEKLHATWHANNRDVWVVTHTLDSEEYYAFLITCEGIQGPVISKTGGTHQAGPYAGGAIGALKLSPDGKNIATTFSDLGPDYIPTDTYLEIGDFDNTTGLVSIHTSIQKPTDVNTLIRGYGVEFSPDNTKVYWSVFGLNPQIGLYQFDLSAPNIPLSEDTIVNGFGQSIMGLQLAPNGIVYAARSNGANYLSAINNPNVAGTGCNFINTSFTFTIYSNLGLPNHWMFPYPEALGQTDTTYSDICPTHRATLKPTIPGPDYLWNTGEVAGDLTITVPGTYWATPTPCGIDTSFFVVEPATFCICEPFIPNAFTPDGDGRNDQFGATSWCAFDNFELVVYDRWGQQVFKSTDQNILWDGSAGGAVKPDVYVWTLRWTDREPGAAEINHIKRGHVVLIK